MPVALVAMSRVETALVSSVSSVTSATFEATFVTSPTRPSALTTTSCLERPLFLPAPTTIWSANWPAGAPDHAGRDRAVVLREARAVEVAEDRLQLGVLADGGLVEDRLLAGLVALLAELLVLVAGVDQAAEPARGVAERARDALGADLERAQDARAAGLDAVQEAAVGLPEVDGDERERDDAQDRDDESSTDDRAGASRRREMDAAVARSPPRALLTFREAPNGLV